MVLNKIFVSTFRKKCFVFDGSMRNIRWMGLTVEELPQIQNLMRQGHFEAVVEAITTGNSSKLPPTFQTSRRILTAEPRRSRLKIPKLCSYKEWAEWWEEESRKANN